MRNYLVLCLLVAQLAHAKTIELGFPNLEHRVQVAMPDDMDTSQKYPAVFYYHGMGGKPDTSLIRNHVDGREWIVVGMEYSQPGKFTYTEEALEKELTLLRSVRRHLAEKRGLDQRRCYVAGFSKGGWIADLLLQSDPTLAGGVILGAGHLQNAKGRGLQKAYKLKNKPVFIGVGRLDGNYPFALRAVLHHRSLGARTTLETWHGLAHTFPKDGSTALQQWFVTCIHPREQLRTMAEKEMRSELSDAQQLAPYAQWQRLRSLIEYPYSYVLGDEWRDSLKAKIASLESAGSLKTEAAFLKRHRQLLFREINEHSVMGMAKINIEYQNLIQKAPKAKQADLARHDHKRTQQLYLQYKEQDASKKSKAKEPFAPIEPKMPESRRGIPINPLVR